KSFAGGNPPDLQPAIILESPKNVLKFILPEQSVIDKQAGQPVSNSASHQSRRDCRVHPARQPAHSFAVTNLLANPGDSRFHKRSRSPVPSAPTNPFHEI